MRPAAWPQRPGRRVRDVRSGGSFLGREAGGCCGRRPLDPAKPAPTRKVQLASRAWPTSPAPAWCACTGSSRVSAFAGGLDLSSRAMDWRAARRTLPTAASRCWSAVTRPPSQASWPPCGGHTCRVGWIRSRSTHRQAGRSSAACCHADVRHRPSTVRWCGARKGADEAGRGVRVRAPQPGLPAATRGHRSLHRQDDHPQADPIAGCAGRLVGPLERERACDDRPDLDLDLADQRPGQGGRPLSCAATA